MTAATEQFAILGDVGAPVFAIWIARHAARLGLQGRVLAQTSARVDLQISGPVELLDAMALACSLGPQEVWVDRIDRLPANAAVGQDSCSVHA
jgi:hypothetical protein